MTGYEITYLAGLAVAKISILIFFARSFALRTFRIAAWLLSAITIIWALLFAFLLVFWCLPISNSWNTSPEQKAAANRVFYISNAVPNIVTDVAMLVLPLFHVWKLRLPSAQRITLTFIFLLGWLYVVVIAIIR